MATITAAMVKELRETTSVGMMDCKKALTETDGDMEKAIAYLREKGLAASAKKAGRIATEGIVSTFVSEDNKIATVVEVNSETDFVAKNQLFKDYVNQVAKQLSTSASEDIETFFEETWEADSQYTVKEALSQQVAVIGENLNIRRFARYTKSGTGKLVSYVHGGGKIGVLVEISSDNENDSLVEMGQNLAMQIAALNPQFIDSSEVPADYIEKETEILTAQAKNDPANAGKPDNIIEGMIKGRLKKGLKDVCLMEQAYVKEGKMSVQQYIESIDKSAKITRFVRFETGEGLEKKEENFADEVAKAMS